MIGVRQIVKSAFQRFGYDIRNVRAEQKFFGLTSLPIETVIDVGANRGQFARRAIKAFPEARIVCFEPVPEAFELLRVWAESVSNPIDIFNVALGSEPESREFFVHSDHTMSSSFLRTTELLVTEFPYTREKYSVQVDVHILDEYREQIVGTGLEGIVLKLDVEGFELDVIKGAPRTLENVVALIVEIHLMELFEGHPTFWDVNAFLSDRNYRFAGSFPPGTSAAGRVIGFDAIFIREDEFDLAL